MIFVLAVIFFLIVAYFLLVGANPSGSYHYLRKKGEELELILQQVSWSSGNLVSISNVPEYKYFSSIFRDLLEACKALGVDITPRVTELRDQLRKDLAFEKRKRKILISGLFQMLGCAVIVNLMILQIIVSFEYMAHSNLVVLFGIQLLGAFISYAAARLVDRLLFSPFEEGLLFLFRLLTLVGLGGSQTEILKKCDDGSFLYKKKKGYFEKLQLRVLNTLEIWRKIGVPPQGEIKIILAEHWDKMSLVQDRSKNTLSGIIFGAQLIFFFLPYLAFLFSFSTKIAV